MTVFAYRTDLLGSTLMNVAHAWGFADKIGQRLCVNWIDPHPNRPPMPWREIFQPCQAFDVVGIPPPPEIYCVPREPRSSAGLTGHVLYPHTAWAQLDYEAKADSEARIRKLWATLPVQPVVTAAVDAVSHRVGDFTAVHVRRGADVLDLMRPDGDLERAASIFVKRYADLETYREAVKASSPRSIPLVVFSNDPREARKFSTISGRTALLAGNMWEFKDLTPTQRDFAELLLMAHARQIIGTRSNYSALARLLGNCPLVLVHKWMTPERLGPFVERTVPPHAVAAVNAAYAKVLSRLAR